MEIILNNWENSDLKNRGCFNKIYKNYNIVWLVVKIVKKYYIIFEVFMLTLTKKKFVFITSISTNFLHSTTSLFSSLSALSAPSKHICRVWIIVIFCRAKDPHLKIFLKKAIHHGKHHNASRLVFKAQKKAVTQGTNHVFWEPLVVSSSQVKYAPNKSGMSRGHQARKNTCEICLSYGKIFPLYYNYIYII